MTPPTARQSEILAAVVRHMATHGGQVPTIEWLCGELEIKSKNGVSNHLKVLAKKGLISEAERSQARSFRVCGLAEHLEAAVREWAAANGVAL